MGWKCPNCGHHNYKAGRCTGCNPDYCCVCDSHVGVSRIQHHHVSYRADVTVPVCKTCHYKIHHIEGYHDELTPDLTRQKAEQNGMIACNR